MSKQLKLKIITPERTVLEEMVDSVTLPTTEGEITILPGHIALVSALKTGDIVARVNGEPIPMAVAGGFIEVKQMKVFKRNLIRDTKYSCSGSNGMIRSRSNNYRFSVSAISSYPYAVAYSGNIGQYISKSGKNSSRGSTR